MNGEQSGLRLRQAAPQELLVLSLDVRRVLEGAPVEPIGAEFWFDPSTPMVVTVAFTPRRGPGVTWRIGRELLYHGLFQESGEGDVQVWPTQGDDGEAVWLLLESKNASAVFELPLVDLEEWLDATYEVVPAEKEMAALDWEGLITDLLDRRGQPGE